jgi:Domain of unknown function (DUF4124)
MANQLGVGKKLGLTALGALFGLGIASSAAADPNSKDGVVYRSVDKEGRTVYSDRPLGNSTPVGAYSSANNAADVALRERDYWRQRADAFAERQRQRDREFEETRRVVLKSEQSSAASVVVLPTYFGGYGGSLGSVNAASINPVYETTPGAVRGRWVTPLFRF